MAASAALGACAGDMDVANLSLAAAFGTPDSSDAVAADSAVKAGVVVVAAAGNDGDIPYVLSSPGASSKAIAVAAAEARPPSAELALPAAAGAPARTVVALDGGPRTGDSALKPDIAAPGEGIVSTLIGSGTRGIALSGTSMATPLVAGTAALVRQAHPRWQPAAIKSAILNGGNPDELTDYATRRAGAGMVNAAAAVATLAYAFADRDQTTLNLGLAQFTADFTGHRTVRVKNTAATAVTFTVAATHPQGSPHQVALGASQLTVPARSEAEIDVAITVPAATAGNSDDFRDVAGLIAFTPTAGGNRGVALRVPYYGVPRVSSSVATVLEAGPPNIAVATISNTGGAIAGTADLYTWGLHSPNDRHGRIDLRAAGAQAFDVPEGRIVVFGINTFRGWSSPGTQEFDVLIDSDGDGAPDFDVFNADFGLLTTGARGGVVITVIFNLHTGALTSDFQVRAPTDASTILLAVLAPSIGVTPDNPRFSYTASSFDLLSTDSDAFAGTARFNAFHSATSNAFFFTLQPGDLFRFGIDFDPAELAFTPARGVMLISQDNQSGPAEAQLLKLPAQ